MNKETGKTTRAVRSAWIAGAALATGALLAGNAVSINAPSRKNSTYSTAWGCS